MNRPDTLWRFEFRKYRGENKGLYFLLSRSQAGPGKIVKQEQEEISRNHVQTFIYLSVYILNESTFSSGDATTVDDLQNRPLNWRYLRSRMLFNSTVHTSQVSGRRGDNVCAIGHNLTSGRRRLRPKRPEKLRRMPRVTNRTNAV